MHTTITPSRRSSRVTLINVFTVEPAKQQALVEVLTRATDDTIRHLPGFISANIHKSLDGTRVTNYAQWRSREDLEAMLKAPAAQPHLKEATALATTVEPHLYEVATVRTAKPRPESVAVGAAAAGALAIGSAAIGALALGALAVGALAVGRLAIGSLALGHGRAKRLDVGDVRIGRLAVRELVVTKG